MRRIMLIIIFVLTRLDSNRVPACHRVLMTLMTVFHTCTESGIFMFFDCNGNVVHLAKATDNVT